MDAMDWLKLLAAIVAIIFGLLVMAIAFLSLACIGVMLLKALQNLL
jgi:hypothetical protein